VDLLDRAGHLKGMLVEFALSPRFDRELSAVIARSFPDGVVTDESAFSMVLDHFALQHRLPSGNTVVEAFAAAHPELTGAERDMLVGWRDVIEGVFEVTGKDRDALVLFNLLDELTYRARSNLGRRAFKPLKKGMILVGRLVRAGEDWMVSGNPAAFPAAVRDQMLAAAAKQAMRHPEAVFRNPAKLAEARRVLAGHHQMFVDLFGADLIVVPGTEVPGKVEAFHRHLAQQIIGEVMTDGQVCGLDQPPGQRRQLVVAEPPLAPIGQSLDEVERQIPVEQRRQRRPDQTVQSQKERKGRARTTADLVDQCGLRHGFNGMLEGGAIDRL